MKYNREPGAYGVPVVEMTRRNLTALLDKLDDPLSARTLSKDGMAVTAVEGDAKPATSDRVQLARKDIEFLLSQGAQSLLVPGGVEVRAVEDDEHYADRAPGAVYMPSTGEFR